jgi:hypothetical protein
VKRKNTSNDPFTYEGYDLEGREGKIRLTCRYSIGELEFNEIVTFDSPESRMSEGLDEAARLVFLLAGVSYYKTKAPSTIDLGNVRTTGSEREFLLNYYRSGLAEFAYRNRLDLSDIVVVGPERDDHEPVQYKSDPGRPLVPFGGGIDSIVAVESVKASFPEAALFVVSPPGERFDAIENAIGVTGLEAIRCEREIDRGLLNSKEVGFLNGHVPITGIISAVAVMAAVLHGRDCVVMSNEWSASLGNLLFDGREVNHQWSKGVEFEREFRDLLTDTFEDGPEYFSILRPRSELWVSKRFSELCSYHRVFRSCNRAFHQDRELRLESWCGECDKCCFIDLILSAFMDARELKEIFAPYEPLENPDLVEKFRTLLGIDERSKPFECVGGVDECRAAIVLSSRREDRSNSALLQRLANELRDASAGGPAEVDCTTLLAPLGDHYIPDDYLIAD